MADFRTNHSRGYYMILRVNQTKVGQVRAQVYLINGRDPKTGIYGLFHSWDVTASMTIAGQTFSYAGRPYVMTPLGSYCLIDKTVNVDANAKTIAVSASMRVPTGTYYLPANGNFSVSNNYAMPRFDSGGNTTSSQDRCGSLTWTIPADSSGEVGSLNEYIWWRQVFWCHDWSQGGFIKMTVSDENDRFMYGVETIKRKSGTETEYNFLVRDGDSYKILDTKKFVATHEDKDNPFNHTRGSNAMKRSGDGAKVSFHYWGKYFDYDIPALKGVKATKLHLTIGTLGGLPQTTYMFVREVEFRKDNVSYEEDVPNRYRAGSTIEVDSEKDIVKYNGVNANNEVVVGSDFITIPPGDSTLEVFYSDWIDHRPDISVSFEERYL